jgi:nuclease HARBI1
MSNGVWNTGKERKEFNKLLEICKDALQNDVVLLDDPFEDEIDDLLFLTAVYGPQISSTMESTVDFSVRPLRVAHLDDVQCVADFRFRKKDLSKLIDALRLPLSHFLVFCGDTDYVRCRNNYKIPYETGVLLVMFRLARPHRIRSDMERMFHCRRSKICAAFHTFIAAFFEVATAYLSDPLLLQDRFPEYAEAVARKTGVHGLRIWGFIDGTLLKICRPTWNQKAAYSGHKRIHGLKFQNVTTPDGLIANLSGPIAGCRHDSHMLTASETVDKLRDAMPGTDGRPIYAMYGDPAYPQSPYLMGSFAGAADGSVEAAWNAAMAKARICVEWTFGDVGRVFRYLSLRQALQVYRSPVAKYYFVAVFLLNCRCCIYENTTSKHFKCKPLSLDEYLERVDWN